MKTPFVTITLTVCLLTLFFSSCSKEDTTYQINSKLVELKCDKTFALEITPTLDGLTYTSLNTNIATVSNTGLIKAKLVGTTKIVVKDMQNLFIDTVKVVVTSMYTSYVEPCLNFGSTSISIIKSLDLTKYTYNYYQTTSYNYIYMYDKSSDDVYSYNYYYFSKDDKLLLSRVILRDNGELDWHISSRYNPVKTFNYTSRVMYITETDTLYDTYTYNDSFFINPDSTLLVACEKTSGSTYSYLYFFQASKEIIERIINTDEDKGSTMISWLFYSKLYPNGEYDYLFESPMKMRPMLKQPENLRQPEKQLHGIGFP